MVRVMGGIICDIMGDIMGCIMGGIMDGMVNFREQINRVSPSNG